MENIKVESCMLNKCCQMLPLGNLERQTVKGASAIISLSTFLTWWTGFIEIFIYLFIFNLDPYHNDFEGTSYVII